MNLIAKRIVTGIVVAGAVGGGVVAVQKSGAAKPKKDEVTYEFGDVTKQSIKSLSSILHMLGWRARRTAQARWWEHKDAQARGTYPTQAEQMQARKALS